MTENIGYIDIHSQLTLRKGNKHRMIKGVFLRFEQGRFHWVV